MNASIKLLGALATSLALGTGVFAQTVAPTATSTSSAGLLGHRYVEAGAAYTDIRNSDINAISGGVTLNVPLNTYADLSVDYAHVWTDDGINVGDSADFSATGYFTSGQLKPYGTLSLGYVWVTGDDHSVWGARAGVEYEATPRFAYTASAGYDDDFRSGDSGVWDGEVKAIYAFTEKFSATASFTFIEGGDRAYGLGAVFKF